MTNTYCCVYSVETPDDGQQICPKHLEFFTKINLRNSASCWFLLQAYTVMHSGSSECQKKHNVIAPAAHCSVCYTSLQSALTVLTWRMRQQACLKHRYQTALRHIPYNCSLSSSCPKSLQSHSILCSRAVHSMLVGKVLIYVRPELAVPVSR